MLRYRQYKPAPDMAGYVDRFWVLEAPGNPFERPERLVPDGKTELIFNFGAAYKRHPAEGGEAEMVASSHFVGERGQGFLLEQQGEILQVSARFKAGGLYPFLQIPLSEITDRTVAADLMLGKAAGELEARIYEARTPAEKVNVLQAELRCMLGRAQPYTDTVRAAVQLIHRTSGAVQMSSLADRLAMSPRQLERLFLQHVVLTQKHYARVVRFRMALRALQRGGRLRLITIAQESGYFDQAHFARDFRKFTGTTPGAYLSSRNVVAEMLAG